MNLTTPWSRRATLYLSSKSCPQQLQHPASWESRRGNSDRSEERLATFHFLPLLESSGDSRVKKPACLSEELHLSGVGDATLHTPQMASDGSDQSPEPFPRAISQGLHCTLKLARALKGLRFSGADGVKNKPLPLTGFSFFFLRSLWGSKVAHLELVVTLSLPMSPLSCFPTSLQVTPKGRFPP